MERRLVAILAADVVGYSRLIGANEASTLSQLRTLRTELVEPALKRHRGRVVKLMGDGLLAEFSSVVDAVTAAVEIQEATPELSAHLTEDRRVALRIGVNIGDIAVEDGDIFGDGVNVAARLQEIADPNGVAISDDAYRQLSGRLDVPFEDAGEKVLKNIKQSVRTWMWPPMYKTDAASASEEPFALPDKPSVAVLPFDNMSGDPEQEYFADGVAEDIITALSRFRSLFVIARNSSFTYKGRAVDIVSVGRELGVRYVVEGSVRKAGNRIRITAQLIDAASGSHLWADRFDGALEDVFDLQDRITEQVVVAVEPEIQARELERARRTKPNDFDAWNLYLHGTWHMSNIIDGKGSAQAKKFLHQACTIDPQFAAAYAELSWAYMIEILLNITDNEAENLDQAAEYAERAVSLDMRDATAHHALGRVHIRKQAYKRAIAEMEAAIELNSSYDRAYHGLGTALVYDGDPAASILEFEQAIRLNPRSTIIWSYYNMLARAHFNMGDFEDASEVFDKATQYPNAPFLPFAYAAATMGHLGHRERAGEFLAEAMKRKPDFSLATVQETTGRHGLHSGVDRIIEGLRKAGLSE